MIVVMKIGATQEELKNVIEKSESLGFSTHVIEGKERSVVGLVGIDGKRDQVSIVENMPGVDRVVPISKPYKLASREVKSESSLVNVKDVVFGGKEVVIMAGPCSVENEDQIIKTAQMVKAAGAKILRGGAFKPRTNPYSFQGLGEEGLKLLAKAREVTGLPVVTEVVNPRDVDIVYKYADMFQVGARNTQNFALLSMIGKTDMPVLLKRGMSTTIDEFLQAAEYILSEGNKNVVLCERGMRTFETATRNTLDIGCVPVVKSKSHLPIIVDPSHAAGHTAYVPALSKAAVAAGADGLIIEVHPEPEKALSDASQQLTPDEFVTLVGELNAIAHAVGRYIV
jgi:3-deoxy-7-phosphoheptulonate synthase